MKRHRVVAKLIPAAWILGSAMAFAGEPPLIVQRMVEWTIDSHKRYRDPFNDVDVDVVFEHDGKRWRVPTFWRGGSRWTVRFAPPAAGEYAYHLESTDPQNTDLNGHNGHVTIRAYSGSNRLLRHGMLKVSANRRYFEHADGTPFYWLGDTWWSGLSTRLTWLNFQELATDRRKKGFTVVQLVAGLVPSEEQAPSDPGFCNEGGCVWDPEFKRINPAYFDYADRRIQYLLDSGLVPAIVGAWDDEMAQMGVEKLKKHWRYIIARYGAYPAFWIIGGEVFDPLPSVALRYNQNADPDVRVDPTRVGGWSELARYVRGIDPLRQPLSVHQIAAAEEVPLQEESLTDFELFQPSHAGWASIGVELTQLDSHYARTDVTKPLVIGEIGYEQLGEAHLADFQRVAFWEAMLNGATGFTYGANGVWESYSSNQPFQRLKWSLLTWREGMKLAGSYQLGLGAELLQRYPWWRVTPHPEWVIPRGTTLLEPRAGKNDFHLDILGDINSPLIGSSPVETEWHRRGGNFRLPYAAGIPRELRIIYIPYLGFANPAPPTIVGLEAGVRYRAYFWEPSLGIRIDMGTIERATPGKLILQETLGADSLRHWTDYGEKSSRSSGALRTSAETLAIVDGVAGRDLVARVRIRKDANASLILRFHDRDNYLAARYSAQQGAIYLLDRSKGVNGDALGRALVGEIRSDTRLTAEAKGGWAAVSVTDGEHTYTSEIVHVHNTNAGGCGVMHASDGTTQAFADLELRESSAPAVAEHLDRALVDARGMYRGELKGPSSPLLKELDMTSWDDFGKERIVLIDAYRPDRLPYGRDWILVLDRQP
jgi:hypothetical protein